MSSAGKLKGLYKQYMAMVETMPGAEYTFKLLCNIEAVLKEVAEGRARVLDALKGGRVSSDLETPNSIRDLTEARIMAIVTQQRASISDLLQLMSDKLQSADLQWADIETVLLRLGIFFKKLDFVIVLPDEGEYHEPYGGTKPREEPEYGNLKFLLLINLLWGNGVYTDDMIVKPGIITGDMRREITYLYIEIPRIKRYILLCNEYGEATFVGKGTLTELRLKETGKEELKTLLGAVKIEFAIKDQGKFLEELCTVLFDGTTDFSAKPDVKEIEKYRTACLDICPTPEAWMGMKQTEKSDFELFGKKLIAIGSILGCTSPDGKKSNPVSYSKHMAVIGGAIYGEGHDIIECEFWDKEKWIKKIKEVCPTPEIWMEMKRTERRDFELFGKKLTTIGTLLGCVSPDGKRWSPVSYPKHMAVIGGAIYGENHDVIECEFWDKKKWIKKLKEKFPTPEKWMGMKTKEKENFELFGKTLTTIGTLLGCVSPDGKRWSPVNSSKHMAVIGGAIYGEGHDIIECEFWDKKKWIKKLKEKFPTPEKWMGMKTKEKEDFNLLGQTLTVLGTLLGCTSPDDKPWNPVNHSKHMAVIGRAIYGEGHECIESLLRDW